MKKNGWILEPSTQDSMNPGRKVEFSQVCGNDTWYGYADGDTVGSVQPTFEGNGKATLDFGNCQSQGYVKVFLNGVEISRANAMTPTVQVIFEYSKGDTLLIKELKSSIIKINSLNLSHQVIGGK